METPRAPGGVFRLKIRLRSRIPAPPPAASQLASTAADLQASGSAHERLYQRMKRFAVPHG